MQPCECRDQAASALRRAGFTDLAAGSGSSRYLAQRGGPFKIRVSTHRVGNSSRHRYADVLVSLVFLKPATAAEIEAAVSAAIVQFHERAAARLREASA